MYLCILPLPIIQLIALCCLTPSLRYMPTFVHLHHSLTSVGFSQGGKLIQIH